MAQEPTVAEMIAALTWEQITLDGIITLEEIDAMLRAQGIDPDAGYEEMYG